jgi:cytochrome c oxidase subunit 4
MSQHHSHNEEQFYYEGDQSKLYSGIMNHHFNHDLSSPESKTQIGRIWKVFWILLFVTIVEVVVGMFFSHAMPKVLVITFFLVLTILKAAYIVSVFMHLGDERKNFRLMILMPLVLFIWFIIAFLYDGDFWLFMNTTAPMR